MLNLDDFLDRPMLRTVRVGLWYHDFYEEYHLYGIDLENRYHFAVFDYLSLAYVRCEQRSNVTDVIWEPQARTAILASAHIIMPELRKGDVIVHKPTQRQFMYQYTLHNGTQLFTDYYPYDPDRQLYCMSTRDCELADYDQPF